jgi:3-deoxy-D-arabino-heptulosonate 7-phosphate (DAHP) synthase class II
MLNYKDAFSQYLLVLYYKQYVSSHNAQSTLIYTLSRRIRETQIENRRRQVNGCHVDSLRYITEYTRVA